MKIDKRFLLGHRSERITTHYSAAELKNLYDATNRVCKQNGSYPTLTLLKRRSDYSEARQKLVNLRDYANERERMNTESRKSHAEGLGN